MADNDKHGKHQEIETSLHELSEDVNFAGLAWFIIGLTVALVFIGWLMIGLLDVFKSREAKAELRSKPSPFAMERNKLPPEPRLQLAPESPEQIEDKQPPDLIRDHPLAEMKELRTQWDRQLNEYGWIDQKAGIARIPISEAKKLLLQRGLPTRTPPKTDVRTAATGSIKQQ